MRLPEKDRVRSVYLADTAIVTTTVPLLAPLAAHTFQDDVTVIGFELTLFVDLLDVHLNADWMALLVIELSRQAALNLPGALGRATIEHGWTAAISLGGGLAKNLVIMFPTGKGVEIDEGEVLNLLGWYNYIGAGGTIDVHASAIVFYTER